MQKRNLILLVSLIIFALFLSCNKYVRGNNANMQSKENIITAEGSIIFQEFEGGFFGIITDDGNKYKPVNLPVNFQRDGLRVRFEGKLNADLVGIHMWGTLIEIINMKEL
jgi:hypothetical protein